MTSRLFIASGLSAPDTIDGSATVLDDILIDFGVCERFDGADSAPSNPYRDLIAVRAGRPFRAVLLTHSHSDHVAGLPFLHKAGLITKKDTRIIGSPPTLEGALETWQDAINRGAAPYGHGAVMETTGLFEPLPRPGEFEILPGYRGFARSAGHLYGAASYIIQIPSGRRGWFTGDWAAHSMPTIAGMDAWDAVPSQWLPDQIWGTDFTHALEQAHSKVSTLLAHQRLIQRAQAARQQGMSLLILGPAQGKAQDFTAYLSEAGLPCYLDGPMAHRFFDLYCNFSWSDHDRAPAPLGADPLIRPVDGYRHRQALLESAEPMIVYTTSMTGEGIAFQYLKEVLARENWIVASSSYNFPDTPIWKLHQLVRKYPEYSGNEGKRTIELSSEWEGTTTRVVVPVRAAVEHLGITRHSTIVDCCTTLAELIEKRGGEKLDRILIGHTAPENIPALGPMLAPYVKSEEHALLPAAQGMAVNV
ncbi:MAG TPA: MBL fold metallo-hydrolase [Candidatus Paceibacterota bacterium]|nr:MBL fold metallo-hydrolase [Candidatus Paceibacterota bacterium]